MMKDDKLERLREKEEAERLEREDAEAKEAERRVLGWYINSFSTRRHPNPTQNLTRLVDTPLTTWMKLYKCPP